MSRLAIATLGTALILACAPGLALAQTQTLNENVNNTGIPRQAPGLSMSSIYGLNPCSSGLSVGVTTPLFGIGGAAATIDRECETRNNAALAITALHDEKLAREIMCKIKDVREAAIRVHQPCIEDGGRVVAASAPRVAEVPRPGAAPATVVVPAPSSVPQRYAPAMPMRVPPPSQGTNTDHVQVPAFCHTPGLDERLYPECVPNSAAARAAVAQQEAALRAPSQDIRRPQRTVVDREPPAARRSVAPVQIRLSRPAPIAPEPAMQAVAARPRAGCVVPSALRAAYPDCRNDEPGKAPDSHVAPSGIGALTVAAHR